MVYLKGTRELTTSRVSYKWKKIVTSGHLIHIILEPGQGNHAPQPSTKHEALDITSEEDIPNGEITAPLFWIYPSIDEATC